MPVSAETKLTTQISHQLSGGFFVVRKGKRYDFSFPIRPRAIDRIMHNKPLTRSMSVRLYKRYLISPEWKQKVILYKKPHCEICGQKYSLHLHHLTYKNLLFEEARDLATLCFYCHKASHVGTTGLGWLNEPSRSTIKLVNRIRLSQGLKRDSAALFMRRRYVSKHGATDTPDFNFFRRYARDFVVGRQFPFNGRIASL